MPLPALFSRLVPVVLVFALAPAAGLPESQARTPPAQLVRGDFALAYDARGIAALSGPGGPSKAEFLAPGGRLGEPVVKYKIGDGDWLDLFTGSRRLTADPAAGALAYVDADPGSPMRMIQRFATDGQVLDWTIEIGTSMAFPAVLGDLAFAIPWRGPSGENPAAIFETELTKHQFISGSGSFLYFVQPNGEPPYLVVTVHPGTKLEYSTAGPGRGALPGVRPFRGHRRARAAGHVASAPHLDEPGSGRRPGLHGSLRTPVPVGPLLRRNAGDPLQGRLVRHPGRPGHDRPRDLTARFSLHTKAAIESSPPSSPETTITNLGEAKPGHHSTRSRSSAGRKPFNDPPRRRPRDVSGIFRTEPIETLIKKRAGSSPPASSIAIRPNGTTACFRFTTAGPRSCAARTTRTGSTTGGATSWPATTRPCARRRSSPPRTSSSPKGTRSRRSNTTSSTSSGEASSARIRSFPIPTASMACRTGSNPATR